MLVKVNQVVLVVFTLFFAQSLSRSQMFDDLDVWQDVGLPSSKQPESAKADDCRKDLLILVDASTSINRANFVKIKTFLEELVNDTQLDVGPKGTHISILSFSEERYTKVRLDFGNKMTKKELLEFIKSPELDYTRLQGETTRTGYALELANQIFNKTSPQNKRTTVGDVVMIITDGEPRGGTKGQETRRAKHQAGLLKKKRVLIVGIAINRTDIPMEERMQFRNVIKNITTKPEYIFDVDYAGLKNIVNKLVDASCTQINEGDCFCNKVGLGDVYIKPGKTKHLVHWIKPNFECIKNFEQINVQSTKVEPDKKSPSFFGVGSHKISYTYTIKSGERSFDIQPCSVEFTVVSCDCATASTKVVSLQPGNSQATVDWTVPEPPETCSASLKSVTPPNVSSRHSFPFGKHTVKYVYKTNAGDVTCNVNIEVKGELCGGKAYNSNNEVCCCGSSHEKQDGFECCGPFYHNTRLKRCCKNANLVGNKESCPGE